MKTLTATQVCKDLGLQPFVLKFWEAEFDQLSSMVGDKRRYGAKAVKLVKRIQEWVEEENCDFDEVRERLSSTPAAARNRRLWRRCGRSNRACASTWSPAACPLSRSRPTSHASSSRCWSPKR